MIAGDWLFVHGFALGGRYSEQIMTVIARCCANIAVSEYHQLDHVLNLATSPEDYLSIVRGKPQGRLRRGAMLLVWWRAWMTSMHEPSNGLAWNWALPSNSWTTCSTFAAMSEWGNHEVRTCTKEDDTATDSCAHPFARSAP